MKTAVAVYPYQDEETEGIVLLYKEDINDIKITFTH